MTSSLGNQSRKKYKRKIRDRCLYCDKFVPVEERYKWSSLCRKCMGTKGRAYVWSQQHQWGKYDDHPDGFCAGWCFFHLRGKSIRSDPRSRAVYAYTLRRTGPDYSFEPWPWCEECWEKFRPKRAVRVYWDDEHPNCYLELEDEPHLSLWEILSRRPWGIQISKQFFTYDDDVNEDAWSTQSVKVPGTN